MQIEAQNLLQWCESRLKTFHNGANRRSDSVVRAAEAAQKCLRILLVIRRDREDSFSETWSHCGAAPIYLRPQPSSQGRILLEHCSVSWKNFSCPLRTFQLKKRRRGSKRINHSIYRTTSYTQTDAWFQAAGVMTWRHDTGVGLLFWEKKMYISEQRGSLLNPMS